MSTQLTHCTDLNVGSLVFSKAENKAIPNTSISYNRIPISYRNNDGTIGDLIIPTEKLFSFGLQENTDMNSGKVNGYSVSLCLWNKNGATAEEELFISKFEEVVDKCKEHLLLEETKEELGKYDLDESDLKKFNPIYRKREKGRIVEGKSPCLYPKVIVNKKNGDLKINTFFVDSNTGEDINPLTLKEKRMNCVCGIKVESIFVGRTISLQVKIYECVVDLIDSGMKRLFSVARTENKDSVSLTDMTGDEEENDNEADNEDNENNEDNGSIKDEEEEEEEELVVEPEPEKPKRKGGRKKKT